MIENSIEVGVRVQTGPLKAGMEEASAVVQTGTAKMDTAFQRFNSSTKAAMASVGKSVHEAALAVQEATEQIGERLALTAEGARFSAFTVGSAFGGLGAVLGATLIFEFFDKMKEAEIEISHMAEATGVSVARITELQASMQQAGTQTNGLGRQLRILSKAMLQAAEGDEKAIEHFRLLGVSTKGWADELPPADKVLMQMADHMANSTKKTQDFAVASTLLGRGSLQTVAWLKQGSAAIEEQAAKQTALGEAAQSAADQAKALERQEAQLSQTIHTQLLPAFGMSVTAIDLFVGGLMKLHAIGEMTFRALEAGVMAVFQGMKGLANIAMDALHGNWKKMEEDATAASNAMSDTADIAGADIRDTWAKVNADVDELFKRTGEDQAERDTANVNVAGKAAASRLDQWKDELDEKAIAANKYHVIGTETELAFWNEKLKIAHTKGGELKSVHAEIRALERRLGVENLHEFLAEQNDKTQALAKTDKQRVAIEQETLNLMRFLYGEDSAEYKRQHAKMEETVRQQNEAAIREAKKAAAEKAAIAASEIEMVRDTERAKMQLADNAAQFKLNQNLISEKQALKIREDALKAEHQADIEEFAAKLKLYKDDSKEYEKVIKEKNKADQKYALDAQRLDQERLRIQMEGYKNLFASINSTLRTSLSGIIQGTLSVQQAFKNMLGNMLIAEAEHLLELGVKRAERLVLDLAFHGVMKQAEVAQTAAAAAEESGIGFMTSLKQVTQAAMKAAANTYASISAIPIIGPALAVPAAAAAFVAVEGFGALASAEGGWDRVPSTTMALLHTNEMVLPASIAENIRNMNTSSNGGGGGDRAIHISTSGSALDTKGLQQVLRDNSRMISKEVIRMIKLGKI